jgi:hypothetical protein
MRHHKIVEKYLIGLIKSIGLQRWDHTHTHPSISLHPFAQKGKLILPPYLGEMGLEIRGFLAQVEPWLRSGWMIPARRPGLYPYGSAFYDHEFFNYVSQIKKDFGLFEMIGSLRCDKPILFNEGNVNFSGNHLLIDLKGDWFEFSKTSVAAERAIRKLFALRYVKDAFVPSIWDLNLTGLAEPFDWSVYLSMRAIVPSYFPSSFSNPSLKPHDHIGLQIRNLPQNPDRNSNPDLMISTAILASKIAGLPIIVYGKGTDIIPNGFVHSMTLISKSNEPLTEELSLLSSCRLMISPDSGWADLMGWLRIPCLIEQQWFSYLYEGLSPFKPKIQIISPDRSITEKRIKNLLSLGIDDFLLPDPLEARFLNSHLDPHTSENLQYWQDYR